MNPQSQPITTPLAWVKSSYSGHNGDCVEIAALPHGNRALRDSKLPTGPILTFPRLSWTAFLHSV